MTKTIPLLFNDEEYGTHEYGFIWRDHALSTDDEDLVYQSYLIGCCDIKARVIHGVVHVFDSK